MKIKYYFFGFIIAAGIFFASISRAELSAEGDVSFWWVIDEENENGIQQLSTGDRAAQEASGFKLARARLSLYPSIPSWKLFAKIQAEFTDSPQLLDAWISYRPFTILNIYAGQMKIPSTYEVAIDEYHLDFITRSTFSKEVVNYSLVTTPYNSQLRGLNTRYRDQGIGFKGAWRGGKNWDVFRYFAMVGNGLGANKSIGANESSGFMEGNEFGDYLYAIRAEVAPFEWLRIGGHYNRNVHDNMLYEDKTVFDFDRTSWSADAQLKLPWDIRVVGLYGEGIVNDDFLKIGKHDYDYTGWEAKALKGFFNDKLELGIRFDTFDYEIMESDNVIYEDHWTYGITYSPVPVVRMQLNYIDKNTVQKYEKDLDDNILFLNLEMDLNTDLLNKN